MSEEKEERVISAAELDWKKGADYRDRFSEVLTTIIGDRSVILDFGALEEEGKKGGKQRVESVNPYIEHHTRIRVSPKHFEAIVKLLNEQLERVKEERNKTE